MTDARSPNSDLPHGIGRVEIPIPAGTFDDPAGEPVVMHDDLRELLTETKASYCATTALVSLLRSESPDCLDSIDRRGLAELLSGVQCRVELVLDGLVCMAIELGLPDARELAL